MTKIVNCPKCGEQVNIDISKAVDEDGEAYICPKCKYIFRFTEK
jgi:predicted RNA-binding Zn-ribbon protein involved in translation (DUF1610 family)